MSDKGDLDACRASLTTIVVTTSATLYLAMQSFDAPRSVDRIHESVLPALVRDDILAHHASVAEYLTAAIAEGDAAIEDAGFVDSAAEAHPVVGFDRIDFAYFARRCAEDAPIRLEDYAAFEPGTTLFNEIYCVAIVRRETRDGVPMGRVTFALPEAAFVERSDEAHAEAELTRIAGRFEIELHGSTLHARTRETLRALSDPRAELPEIPLRVGAEPALWAGLALTLLAMMELRGRLRRLVATDLHDSRWLPLTPSSPLERVVAQCWLVFLAIAPWLLYGAIVAVSTAFLREGLWGAFGFVANLRVIAVPIVGALCWRLSTSLTREVLRLRDDQAPMRGRRAPRGSWAD